MTPAKPDRFVQVSVTLERRDDGGLRAYSDDVPGFVLSHAEPDLVLADIGPALETILSAMFHERVVAHRMVGVREALEALETEDATSNTPSLAAIICAERYVARIG